VTNSCDVFAAQTDNSRPSFNMVTWHFDPPQQYKSAMNLILHELSKRSTIHETMYASSNATISRLILLITLVFASRGSGTNCRNSAVVLKELLLYWQANWLLSRLILSVIYTHTKKNIVGAWATTQSALLLGKPPGLRGLSLKLEERNIKKNSS